MFRAALYGHFHELEWLFAYGYPPSSKVVDGAARGGRIDVLEWARDRAIQGSDRACNEAALVSGHLNALQWLRANGYPWDHRVIEYAYNFRYDDMLEWAREHGCPERLREADLGGF